MTKKHFILLADAIRAENKFGPEENHFSSGQLALLADFCKLCNPRFNGDRWLAYINGECGPSGGKVK